MSIRAALTGTPESRRRARDSRVWHRRCLGCYAAFWDVYKRGECDLCFRSRMAEAGITLTFFEDVVFPYGHPYRGGLERPSAEIILFEPPSVEQAPVSYAEIQMFLDLVLYSWALNRDLITYSEERPYQWEREYDLRMRMDFCGRVTDPKALIKITGGF